MPRQELYRLLGRVPGTQQGGHTLDLPLLEQAPSGRACDEQGLVIEEESLTAGTSGLRQPRSLQQCLGGIKTATWRRRLWSTGGVVLTMSPMLILLLLKLLAIIPPNYIFNHLRNEIVPEEDQRQAWRDLAYIAPFILLCTGLLFNMMLNKGLFLSKPPRQLLKLLLEGVPRGAFMVSYKWSKLDREVANAITTSLPPYLCWLDVNNLLPGSSVEDACTAAAQSARVAFVLLSPGYLISRNCLLELTTLDPNLACFLEDRSGIISSAGLSLPSAPPPGPDVSGGVSVEAGAPSPQPPVDSSTNKTSLIVIFSQVGGSERRGPRYVSTDLHHAHPMPSPRPPFIGCHPSNHHSLAPTRLGTTWGQTGLPSERMQTLSQVSCNDEGTLFYGTRRRAK